MSVSIFPEGESRVFDYSSARAPRIHDTSADRSRPEIEDRLLKLVQSSTGARAIAVGGWAAAAEGVGHPKARAPVRRCCSTG
eukprot:COSAG02_NODE_2290_length_9205_cov_21.549198_5_plen_82_part_00